MDETGEVDAEEGEGGVGHGVDEVADQVAGYGGEFEIFAAEGDDADVVFCAGEGSDAVAEEAGAVDEVAGFECTGRGFKDPAAEVVVDGCDAGVFLEGAAEAFDLSDERVADGLVIDDAFLRDAEGGEAGGMGFDLADLGGVEPLEAFEAVLLAADFEVTQALDFGFCGGDNDLAADLMGDGVLATEFGHEPDSADGEAGFQRTGLVVEAAVEDAAVVRALVAAGAILFFKDANGCTGLADEQFTGCGQADDTAPDDDEVVFFQWSLTIVAGGENSLHPRVDLFFSPVGVLGSEGAFFDFPRGVIKFSGDGEFLRRRHFADNLALDAVRFGHMRFSRHAYFSQAAKFAATASLGDTSGSMPTGSGHSMPTAGSFHRRARSVSGR